MQNFNAREFTYNLLNHMRNRDMFLLKEAMCSSFKELGKCFFEIRFESMIEIREMMESQTPVGKEMAVRAFTDITFDSKKDKAKFENIFEDLDENKEFIVCVLTEDGGFKPYFAKYEYPDFPKCSFCGKEGKQKKCSVCRIPYCSPECQKEDWKNHKTLCKK